MNKNNADIELLDPFVLLNKQISPYINPFFVTLDGSILANERNNVISDNYESVYILCMRDNIDQCIDINSIINCYHDMSSTINQLLKVNIFTLIKAPVKIINNKTIKNGLVEVSPIILDNYNAKKYVMNGNQLVYLMLESNESIVSKWVDIYNGNDFNKFVSKKIFTSFYGLNDARTNNHMIDLINNQSSFKYWNKQKHCLINRNENFDKRIFNFSVTKWNLPIKEIEAELSKILSDYDKEMGKVNAVEGYTFEKISHTKNKTRNSYYKIVNTNTLNIGAESIADLVCGSSLNEKERLTLICNLLVSKKYCHYVLNNKSVLNKCKNIFNKYNPIIKYFMSYSWITFYIEELLLKTNVKKTDRIVFDIATAKSLPVFSFSTKAPYMNPYYSVPLSKNNTVNVGIGTVKQFCESQKGIVGLKGFRKRLNIFITGTSEPEYNLLDGLNWDNIAITGGCMAAIMPKVNPLMVLFNHTDTSKISLTPSELNRFFKEYYTNSDIDIACNHSSIIEYISCVKSIKDVLFNNLSKKNDIIRNNEINVISNKTLGIFINEDILKRKCEEGTVPFTFDEIINNTRKKIIKTYFYNQYINIKKLSNITNEEILSDKKFDDDYGEIMSYCDIDKVSIVINKWYDPKYTFIEFNDSIKSHFIINDEDTDEPFIRMRETYKFKISSKYLPHTFEVFKIHDSEFFSCIARFHMPCVRSYYDGQNCYMLPSAVTAYQTMINIDFRYFVGSSDPVNIIDKYRKRGYGIILNKIEIKQYIAYVLANNAYKKYYNIKSHQDIQKIIGCLEPTNVFYKPRSIVPEDFTYDALVNKITYKKPTVKFISNEQDIIDKYKIDYPKYLNTYLGFNVFDGNGNVLPPKLWLIEAGFDCLNS